MLKIIVSILAILIIGALLMARSKGVSPLSWKMHSAISQKNDLAIGGFDPVNYFEHGKAEKGDSTFSYRWEKVNWQFISQDHLDTFKDNPSKYIPQFGGWCSFAVSKGFTANPDPNVWHIQAGKLFLFADEGVKSNWIEGLPQIVKKGEEKWTY